MIPREIDGKPVVSIAHYVFPSGEFKTLTIPDSVNEVGSFAFSGCEQLQRVEIPASVTKAAVARAAADAGECAVLGGR